MPTADQVCPTCGGRRFYGLAARAWIHQTSGEMVCNADRVAVNTKRGEMGPPIRRTGIAASKGSWVS